MNSFKRYKHARDSYNKDYNDTLPYEKYSKQTEISTVLKNARALLMQAREIMKMPRDVRELLFLRIESVVDDLASIEKYINTL